MEQNAQIQLLLAKRQDYKTSNGLHFFLSLITAGTWVPIWILVALNNSMARSGIDRKLKGGDKGFMEKAVAILGWGLVILITPAILHIAYVILTN